MIKFYKKGIIHSLIKLIIFVLVIVLLFFLIKNKWNVGEALNDMLALLRLK